MTEINDNMDAGAEAVDQLQPEDTLVDRGVEDVLDEGYTTPEKWSVAQGFGNTAAEQAQGETLEQRIAQEEPEVVREPVKWDPKVDDRQVGGKRAGRLVDARDGSGESFGTDVGIAGGAATAEEAAMHIIEVDDSDDDE